MISRDRVMQSILAGIGLFVYTEQYVIEGGYLGFMPPIKAWGFYVMLIVAIELDRITDNSDLIDN